MEESIGKILLEANSDAEIYPDCSVLIIFLPRFKKSNARTVGYNADQSLEGRLSQYGFGILLV